jgi:hypothetical protein
VPVAKQQPFSSLSVSESRQPLNVGIVHDPPHQRAGGSTHRTRRAGHEGAARMYALSCLQVSAKVALSKQHPCIEKRQNTISPHRKFTCHLHTRTPTRTWYNAQAVSRRARGDPAAGERESELKFFYNWVFGKRLVVVLYSFY